MRSPARTPPPSASPTTSDKQDDPVWAPIFEAFAPVRAWLAEKKPDVLFVIYNDHVTSFFFDHYSAFALGIGESWPVADEGGGARDAAAGPRPPGARAAHRRVADGRRVRPVVLPGPAARPRRASRRCRCWRRTNRTGRSRSCRCRSACCSSRSRRRAAAASSARRCGARSRATPRTCGRDRRHRRAVAPGARRARRLQQHAVGPAVPRPDRARSRAAGVDDARAVRDARRPRGRRGHHVAGDARRDVGARALPAPDATTCRR